MVGGSAEQWLQDEVKDLLTVGSVGLYELIWLLNGSEFDLSDREKISTSNRVVKSLLASGLVRICQLQWPTNEIVDSHPLELESLDQWPSEPSKIYLALVPQSSFAGHLRNDNGVEA